MFKVNSKKAIRRIADKSFLANKTRNIIAVAAIALTSILFAAIFTIGSGLVENLQRQTMRQAGGDGMGVLKYITDEEYEKVKDHELIEEISYNRLLSDSVENEELIKRHGELYYMDDTAIKLGFCEPAEGHKPEAENEIMMDTRTILLLGIERKIGAPVTLELVVHGKEVSRDFVLSGWWEADPAFNVSIMVASKAYMDAHMDELYKNYSEGNWEMAGLINSYIMFRNSWGLEDKLERVIKESGFSLDENADDYIEHNVNWSYLSTNFGLDPTTVIGVVSALLLIILTGYLIIYNIFQISVVKDIRFYGLLKTIGTTGKQVKTIIRRQALTLACIGIPIGLLAGYIIGCGLVPVVMDSIAFGGEAFMVETSAKPLIFVGSAAFSFITVLISTAKPGRIAAKVSPVEAVRYTEGSSESKRKSRRKVGKERAKEEKERTKGEKERVKGEKERVKGERERTEEEKRRAKKGKNGETVDFQRKNRQYSMRGFIFRSKISAMAAANLGRDKKRTVLVVLSMALSLVLFNTVYTFSIGFDMDKFLSRFVQTDFLAAHAGYFNYQYSGIDTSLSESMIEAITEQSGFEEGGRIYANIRDEEFFQVDPPEGGANELKEGLSDGGQLCAVYGMEDFPLKNLEIIEGEIDIEKLKTGGYILEGVSCDDYNNPEWDTSHYAIGEKVALHNHKGTADVYSDNEFMTYEFEVMAKVKVGTYTNSCGIRFDYNFYLPAQVYRQMAARPGIMSFVYNVSAEWEKGMEAFLKNYTEKEEPVMSYTSKVVRAAEFEGMKNMVLLIGGVLSFIIGLIGVLNFINSMLTGIITRRREFAILQSIGMTTGQLRRMLIMEGLLYTASAGITALLLGTAMSLVVIKQILAALWFFSYRFTLLPLFLVIPILLVIGISIPGAMLKSVERQSVVERIREE